MAAVSPQTNRETDPFANTSSPVLISQPTDSQMPGQLFTYCNRVFSDLTGNYITEVEVGEIERQYQQGTAQLITTLNILASRVEEGVAFIKTQGSHIRKLMNDLPPDESEFKVSAANFKNEAFNTATNLNHKIQHLHEIFAEILFLKDELQEKTLTDNNFSELNSRYGDLCPICITTIWQTVKGIEDKNGKKVFEGLSSHRRYIIMTAVQVTDLQIQCRDLSQRLTEALQSIFSDKFPKNDDDVLFDEVVTTSSIITNTPIVTDPKLFENFVPIASHSPVKAKLDALRITLEDNKETAKTLDAKLAQAVSESKKQILYQNSIKNYDFVRFTQELTALTTSLRAEIERLENDNAAIIEYTNLLSNYELLEPSFADKVSKNNAAAAALIDAHVFWAKRSADKEKELVETFQAEKIDPMKGYIDQLYADLEQLIPIASNKEQQLTQEEKETLGLSNSPSDDREWGITNNIERFLGFGSQEA